MPPGEKPNFVWKRNGVDFDPEERFKVLFGEDEDSLALVFQHVKPEDAGIYTCVAQTSTGNISCSAELSVQGAIHTLNREPEKPTLIIEHREAITAVGGSAILELQCKGFPKPAVQWKHEGEIVAVDERHKIMYEDEESMSLIIKNVTTADAGEYTIHASNELGIDDSSIQLVVKSPPSIKKIKDITCTAGETVKFEIEVDGCPIPTLSFTINGRDISSDENVKITYGAEEKNKLKVTLEITNIKLSQSGNFSVRAVNDLSQSSEYWNCTVNSKPVIIKQLDKEYIYGEKETVVMSFRVEAFPEAKITWYHDETEINIKEKKYSIEKDGTEQIIRIKEVTRVDAGIYTAKAENEFGSATTKTEMKVKCTPEFTKKLKNITVVEGDCNVELAVNVDAYPEPRIKWYIDGIEIDEKRKEFRRVEEGKDVKLILKEVNTSIQGQYSVKVENDYGKIESDCMVTVKCKFFDCTFHILKIKIFYKQN